MKLTGGCYAEKWCEFSKELAVMVVRSVDGSVQAFPVVEFTSNDSVCHTTLCPAAISTQQAEQAVAVAMQAIASLPEGAVGVFGCELFALSDGHVVLNEVAPRPHNSGHYTIEACHASQFQAPLRTMPRKRGGSTHHLHI